MNARDSAGARWGYRAGLLGVFALCAAPVLAAFLPLMGAPRETAAEAAAMLGSSRLWGLWAKTCGIALGSALAATALGAPLGLLLEHPRLRDRPWLRALLSAPLLVPAHVLAVAWIDLLGQQGIVHGMAEATGMALPSFPLYTPAGVVLVQALSWYPIPMWSFWNALRLLDPTLPEAARNLGARKTARGRLLAPLLLPAAAVGALIVFLFSLLSFSVPSLLQVPVFTVEIYTSFNSLLDQRGAVLMALPLVLTGFAAATAAQRLHGRTVRDATRTARAPALPQQGRVLPWFFASVVVAGAVGLPVAALIIRSLPPATLLGAWHTGLGEIGVSGLLAILGATLMLGLALPLAWRAPTGARLVLGPAAMAYLVSGPVFGVGLIRLWNHPGLPGYFYDHVTILLLAVTGRYLVFAWIGCHFALQYLPAETVAAARNLGASPWHTVRSVAVPALRRPLIAVWLCLALQILGDVESTVLVAPPGWTPVSLRIFTLMHYGPAAMVSALALLQALAALLMVAVASRFAGSARVYTTGKTRYDRDRGKIP